MGIKHSKYRNTGLIFEFLSRKLTSEVLSGKDKLSLSIINKYFKKGSPLSKDLSLYRILSTKNKSKDLLESLIGLAIKEKSSIDRKILEEERKRVVKEISSKYDLKEFFSQRIDEEKYRNFADLYFLLENNVFDDPDLYLNRKNRLIESITLEQKEKTSTRIVESINNKDISKLSLKLLLDKFNNKYKNLDENQKILVSKYINEDISSSSFRSFILSEFVVMKDRISKTKVKDKALSIKLKEMSSIIDGVVNSKVIKEEYISSLLKFYELDRILNS